MAPVSPRPPEVRTARPRAPTMAITIAQLRVGVAQGLRNRALLVPRRTLRDWRKSVGGCPCNTGANIFTTKECWRLFHHISLNSTLRIRKGVDLYVFACNLCAMKVLKITLSDSAHKRALQLASLHNVPIEAYLSAELEDLIDHASLSSNEDHSPGALQTSSQFKPAPLPNYSHTLPDTLNQVFKVCMYVYKNGTVPKDIVHAKAKFRDAARTVAKELQITESTVRDKCTYYSKAWSSRRKRHHRYISNVALQPQSTSKPSFR